MTDSILRITYHGGKYLRNKIKTHQLLVAFKKWYLFSTHHYHGDIFASTVGRVWLSLKVFFVDKRLINNHFKSKTGKTILRSVLGYFFGGKRL